jgi:hypothetical protein
VNVFGISQALFKGVILGLVGIWAGFWCLVGFVYGGGPAVGVVSGFLIVIVGAFLSWKRPLLGLLITLGAVLASVVAGTTGYSCIGQGSENGCGLPYTTSAKIHQSLFVGIFPVIVGCCFFGFGLSQRLRDWEAERRDLRASHDSQKS